MGTLYAIGDPLAGRFSMRDQSRVIARFVNNVDVRSRAIGSMARQALADHNATADDVAWAIAAADSLPVGEARQAAQIAAASHALARNDTAAAHARLLSLLATHEVRRVPPPFEYEGYDPLLTLLVRVGAEEEALRWARAVGDSAARAAALLGIGHTMLTRAEVGKTFWFSNGPDSCRQEF